MHDKIEFITMSVISIVVMLIAIVSFICAYKLASKKRGEDCEFECDHTNQKKLVVYMLIGSLSLITSFKLHLDHWISLLV